MIEHRALRERIERDGSVRFDEFVELALYAPGEGFFATGGGAGRGGADFLTSPEVGPLFGAVVARYLDQRWHELGEPDPFVVVEAAAGRGALAAGVLAAAPLCSPALRYVLVERSEVLRERQRAHLPLGGAFDVLGPVPDGDDPSATPLGRALGPLLCALEDLPAVPFTGVVLANELLDNLPFRLLERVADGWSEVRVSAVDDQLVELAVPAEMSTARRLDELAPDAGAGARVAWQPAAGEWLRRALSVCARGSVVVVDYTTSTGAMAARPVSQWLRTYRDHGRGGPPLEAPGAQDLTVEVAVDQLAAVRAPDRRAPQAAWLHRHGIDELVEEGRRIWAEQAARPGLEAMRARSRVVEAESLCDPGGLGAFEVLEWDQP